MLELSGSGKHEKSKSLVNESTEMAQFHTDGDIIYTSPACDPAHEAAIASGDTQCRAHHDKNVRLHPICAYLVASTVQSCTPHPAIGTEPEG